VPEAGGRCLDVEMVTARRLLAAVAACLRACQFRRPLALAGRDAGVGIRVASSLWEPNSWRGWQGPGRAERQRITSLEPGPRSRGGPTQQVPPRHATPASGRAPVR
jgi:hypothetical protein